jgi:putative oxidoreductase
MKTVSRIAPIVLRSSLGLIFTAAGITGLLQLSAPPALTGAAGAFMGGLAAAGYFFPLLKTVELVAGLLLLSGRMVPLALTLLAPIVVNIAAFHFLLAPAGAAMSAVVVLLELALAWLHRDAFAPLFRRAPASALSSAQPSNIVIGVEPDVEHAQSA